jgi:glyoxylase-like metal-dependent hydrolase (beta-lactamase superfamily II)
MVEVVNKQLDFGITCIDAGYIRPGLACFYLMEHGGQCAIIETGTSHSLVNLQQVMSEKGLVPEQVRYVIPTHVHLDHAGGAGTMMAAFPNAQLLIHPRGARHMAAPERLIASSSEVYGQERFRQLYGEILPVDATRIVAMEDGQTINLADRQLEFRHTRGHANHHFCVWDETSRGWFSGDMFGISYPWFRFTGGDYILPATTPTQFDPDAYLASLDLLGSYAPQRMYLTHSGELQYSSENADNLGRQVDAYRELAQLHVGDKETLELALSDYSLAEMRKCRATSPEGELRELLAFDVDLNAQGLEVWRQRVAQAGAGQAG